MGTFKRCDNNSRKDNNDYFVFKGKTIWLNNKLKLGSMKLNLFNIDAKWPSSVYTLAHYVLIKYKRIK